jgi:hypothetical protein
MKPYILRQILSYQILIYPVFHNDYKNEVSQRGLNEVEQLSTVDLLVLTSLDYLLFMLKILFTVLQSKLP